MFQLLFWTVALIAGILLISYAAHRFTKYAGTLSKRWGVPEIVIGLSVIAIGTSLPEIVTSFIALYKNIDGFVVGTVVGSNVANLLLVLGVAVFVHGTTMPHLLRKEDGIWLAGLSILVFGLLFLGTIGIVTGLLLLLLYVVFAVHHYHRKHIIIIADHLHDPRNSQIVLVLMSIWLVAIFLGSWLVVDSARSLALTLNLSSVTIIAQTIIAVGTSLPELAVTLLAFRHHHVALGIGNIVGSNIINLTIILGFHAIIIPVHLIGVHLIWGLSFMLFTALVGAAFIFHKKITRSHVIVGLAIYLIYVLGLLLL